MTSPPTTSRVISAITGILNKNSIDNGGVEVHPSDFSVESNSESIPDPKTTLIKSTDDNEMDHLLELSHSEHDDDLLDVEPDIIQALVVVSSPSKFNIVFTVLFHKDRGVNVANLLIFQYPLGFNVDHTDHIMELVNEWLPTRKFRNVDTTFRTDSL